MQVGFWYNGRYFPPIMGGSGEGDEGADDGSDTTNNSGANNSGGNGGSGSGEGSGGSNKITLDNRQLSQRLARERKAALNDLAQTMGFDSFDKLKEKLDSDKTKKEQEQGEVTTLRQQLQTAQNSVQQANQRIRDLSLRHAVEVEASSLGFQDPQDAFGLANFSDIEAEEDGTINRDEIKKRLSDLAKAKKYLLTEDAQTKLEGNGQNPQNNGQQGGQNRGAGRNNGVAGATSNPSRTSGRQIGGLSDAEKKELEARYPVLRQRG